MGGDRSLFNPLELLSSCMFLLRNFGAGLGDKSLRFLAPGAFPEGDGDGLHLLPIRVSFLLSLGLLGASPSELLLLPDGEGGLRLGCLDGASRLTDLRFGGALFGGGDLYGETCLPLLLGDKESLACFLLGGDPSFPLLSFLKSPPSKDPIRVCPAGEMYFD